MHSVDQILMAESTPRLKPGGSGGNPTRSARLSRVRRYSIRALTRPRDHCPGNPLRPPCGRWPPPKGDSRNRQLRRSAPGVAADQIAALISAPTATSSSWAP
jgi:hypothetical protein